MVLPAHTSYSCVRPSTAVTWAIACVQGTCLPWNGVPTDEFMVGLDCPVPTLPSPTTSLHFTSAAREDTPAYLIACTAVPSVCTCSSGLPYHAPPQPRLWFPFLSAHGHSDLLFASSAQPATPATSLGFTLGLLAALLIKAVPARSSQQPAWGVPGDGSSLLLTLTPNHLQSSISSQAGMS